MSLHPTFTAYHPSPRMPSEHRHQTMHGNQYASSSNTESDSDRLLVAPAYGLYHHNTRRPNFFEYNRGFDQNGRHYPLNEETRSDKKMRHVMEQLETMKEEFQKNKDSIYIDKKRALNQELQDLYDGTSIEFQDLMMECAVEQEKEDVRTQAFYKHKLEIARTVYEGARCEIEEEYKLILEQHQKRLLSEIAKKRKLVENDSFDIWGGIIPSHDPDESSNKNDPIGGNGRKKSRTNRQTVLPGASYKEVLEDFHEIFGDHPPACLSNARIRRRTHR